MSKILIIVPSVSGGGGAERTACLLANGLSKSHDVELLAMSQNEPLYELEMSVKYVKIDSHINYNNVVIKNINRLKFLIRECKNQKPDLLIGYTIQGGIITCMVSLLTKIKTIVCERQDPKQFGKIHRIVRDFLYRYADGAVFQTVDAQNYFSSIVKNSEVIPNFIDDDILPKPVHFETRKNIICSAGRLEEAKNHKILINAFANIMDDYPEYVLKIWGDGSLRGNLEQLIKKRKAEAQIILCGRTKDIFKELNDSKVFVLSSNYEGYPNALLEAMSLGNACISTDCPCGGPRDMIENGKNGYLIPINDVLSLERTMRLMLNNEKGMKEISAAAIKKRQANGKNLILSRWYLYIDSILQR